MSCQRPKRRLGRDLARALLSAAGPQPGGRDAHEAPVQPAAAATGRADSSASWCLPWPVRRGKPRGLDQGSHVPADQIPDFGMPDGPLQAETGDLKAARGQPPGSPFGSPGSISFALLIRSIAGFLAGAGPRRSAELVDDLTAVL